jgi:hypothetical protein
MANTTSLRYRSLCKRFADVSGDVWKLSDLYDDIGFAQEQGEITDAESFLLGAAVKDTIISLETRLLAKGLITSRSVFYREPGQSFCLYDHILCLEFKT